jgi:hypothetical protein
LLRLFVRKEKISDKGEDSKGEKGSGKQIRERKKPRMEVPYKEGKKEWCF